MGNSPGPQTPCGRGEEWRSGPGPDAVGGRGEASPNLMQCWWGVGQGRIGPGSDMAAGREPGIDTAGVGREDRAQAQCSKGGGERGQTPNGGGGGGEGRERAQNRSGQRWGSVTAHWPHHP